MNSTQRFNIALGIIIIIFTYVCYLFQMIALYRNKSARGVSFLTFLITLFSSFSNAISTNILNFERLFYPSLSSQYEMVDSWVTVALLNSLFLNYLIIICQYMYYFLYENDPYYYHLREKRRLKRLEELGGIEAIEKLGVEMDEFDDDDETETKDDEKTGLLETENNKFGGYGAEESVDDGNDVNTGESKFSYRIQGGSKQVNVYLVDSEDEEDEEKVGKFMDEEEFVISSESLPGDDEKKKEMKKEKEEKKKKKKRKKKKSKLSGRDQRLLREYEIRPPRQVICTVIFFFISLYILFIIVFMAIMCIPQFGFGWNEYKLIFGEALGYVSAVTVYVQWLPQICVTILHRGSGSFSQTMLLIMIIGAVVNIIFLVLGGQSAANWMSYLVSGIQQVVLFVLILFFDFMNFCVKFKNCCCGCTVGLVKKIMKKVKEDEHEVVVLDKDYE